MTNLEAQEYLKADTSRKVQRIGSSRTWYTQYCFWLGLFMCVSDTSIFPCMDIEIEGGEWEPLEAKRP